MRIFEKTKGAVSLFLVIILVPMMTLSGLFVDASKVNLARAMAESAGDLTLNTALTNYDSDLKELYGLMATAQNMDDLFEKLEDYYKTCITSSGVSEEDAQTYVGQIMSQLGAVSESKDTADIMNMRLVEFSVEKYTDANLANAAILEKQIVDFMKYRAPINTGLSFLSSLKSFSTLSKQTELVEKKQNYYEAQQGVMEYLKEAWQQIANYNSTNLVTNAGQMSEILSTLSGMETGEHGYKKLHTYLVKDLYHTGDYMDYSASVSESNGEYMLVWNGQTKGAVKRTSDLPTEAELKEAVTYLKNAVETAKATRESKNWECTSGDYQLQYLVQLQRNGNKLLEAYTQQMIEVHSWYLTLDSLYTNLSNYDENIRAKEEELEKTEEETEHSQEILDSMTTTEEMKQTVITVSGATKQLQQWYEELRSSYSSEMQQFHAIAERMSQYSVSAKAVYSVNKAVTTEAVAEIADQINSYVNELQASSDYLQAAIEALEAARKELASGGSVAKAQMEWSSVANDKSITGTSLAKQDQAEIAQLDSYLTAENVSQLQTRLENIKTEIDRSIAQIKNYTYCGTFIGEIRTYEKLESVIEQKIGKAALEAVPVNEAELNTQAASWWSSCWQDGGLSFEWLNQSGKQPDLTKDKCAMYSYLYSHFAAVVTAEGETKKAEGEATTSSEAAKEDSENGVSLYKNIKNTAKAEAKEEAENTDKGQAGSETKNNNIAGLSNLPSAQAKTSGGETPDGSTDVDPDTAAGSASSSLGNLFSKGFLNAVAVMATDLRDKLYVSDYAMSMFTYDTIENEYKIENDMDAAKELSEGTLMSLTKNALSTTNNYAYGTEVEYIIYGGTNEDNLTKAYGTIYGIRFGFNLIYAFATSEIRESALAIATPISAATLGVIPVPLIQAAIIIALACCESAVDLVDLRAGYQIPLYKSKKTWVCSVSGLTQKAKNAVGTVVREHVNKTVDEGINQLNNILDMTDEELSKLIENGTNNIEASVTEAYDQLITENANLAIQTLTTFVTDAIEATRCLELEETYEQKKAEAIAGITAKLENWRDAQTGSDVASIVKREAVNVILSNQGALIEELFETMEASVQNTAPGEEIAGILAVEEEAMGELSEVSGAIMSKIKQIRQQITYKITNTCTEVKNFKTQSISKVKGALNSGAENVKENLNSAINDCLDELCGTDGAGGDTGVGTASLCSFAYSDYLRLFTLIGLYANEEMVVLRIGDVIQTNMAKCIKKGDNASSYQLQSAAAYVKVSTKVQVKPTFLALPLFADLENNPVTDTSWYTISYDGMAGY